MRKISLLILLLLPLVAAKAQRMPELKAEQVVLNEADSQKMAGPQSRSSLQERQNCVAENPALPAKSLPARLIDAPVEQCTLPDTLDSFRIDSLGQIVYRLCSEQFAGRQAGTAGSTAAREYLLSCYRGIGLEPLFGDSLQFRFSRYGTVYSDIVGVIRPLREDAEDRYIVLGAHYDHLGRDRDGKMYPGADDNASGSAALFGIASYLMQNRDKLGCNVIIAAFDAEEIGLYGSEALMQKLEEEGLADKIKLMASIDMVGWYAVSGYLRLEGSSTLRNSKQILGELAESHGIRIRLKGFEDSVFTATDTDAFARNGIPTLAVTTGLKSPYHKTGDLPELIDYKGLDMITGYLGDLAAKLSSRGFGEASGRLSAKHRRPVFQAGISLGASNSMILYKGSSIRTTSRYGLEAGLEMKLNLGRFALVSGLGYDYLTSGFPASEDMLGSSARYSHHALRVPLVFGFQGRNPGSCMLGAGPYLTRVLATGADVPELDFRKWQYGYTISFCQPLGGKLLMNVNINRSLVDVYKSRPGSRLSNSDITFVYLF